MPIDYTKRPAAPAAPAAPAPAAPAPAAPAAPAGGVSLSKVTLTKAAPAVSLTKSGGAGGVLRVNLRWTARTAPGGSGFFRKTGQGEAIDLDLGCLYEYSDGSKGVVQALGNSFRDRHTMGGESIVWLDGDDRSGSSEGGENLFVNLANPAALKRILVFCYIYEGTPNWAQANAVVTLYPVAGPQVEIHLDEPDPSARMVAIAMVENSGGEVVIRREVRYVQGGQSVLDQLYGWGMSWKAGRK